MDPPISKWTNRKFASNLPHSIASISTLLGLFCCVHFTLSASSNSKAARLPLIISTWDTQDFQAAAQHAYDALLNISNGNTSNKTSSSYRRISALVEGLSECERLRCDRTVGYGGSPDELGETTLDSMLMDGPAHKYGAVAALRRIKNAAKVAWAVMNYTEHSLLVGEKATDFALSMGFPEESLLTPESEQMHQTWLQSKCQPNFWKDVSPNPRFQCGPYEPIRDPADQSNSLTSIKLDWKNILLGTIASSVPLTMPHLGQMFGGPGNHDTIGMVLVDEDGNVAAGTSSNGARNKIPGRVGDSPIVGSGAYVDNEVGGAAATGDGDVMMRFVPSFFAVEQMRQGKSPTEATIEAIRRIKRMYPTFMGAVIATTVGGQFGAACSGLSGGFGYSVVDPNSGKVRVERVQCE